MAQLIEIRLHSTSIWVDPDYVSGVWLGIDGDKRYLNVETVGRATAFAVEIFDILKAQETVNSSAEMINNHKTN